MIGGFFNKGVYRKIVLSIIGAIQSSELGIIGKGMGATKTTTAIIGNCLVEEFAINDELFVAWIFPTNLDKNKDMIIELALSPTGAEVAKTVSFDLVIQSVGPTSIIGGTTGTVQFIDIPVPVTLNERFNAILSISSSLFLNPTPDIDALHIKIKRVASSADPVADVALNHVKESHSIN